jgi:hypothetical protein
MIDAPSRIHLWNFDHDYYCNEEAWSDPSRTSHIDFTSWDNFKTSNWYEADLDYELLFRWDWHAPSEELGLSEHLELFFMGQRHGRFRAVFIRVTPEDEEEVRAYLQIRFDHLMWLWMPFSIL